MLAVVAFVATLVAVSVAWLTGARLSGWSAGFDVTGRTLRVDIDPGSVVMSVPDGAPAVRLHVLSHNVWCHYLVPAPGRRRRLAALADHIASATPPYDVVMLQELFLMRLGPWVWSRELEFFTARMRQAGFKYTSNPFKTMPTFGQSLLLKVQNSGLMTYSRHPLISSDSVAFTVTGERTNCKGFESSVAAVPLGGEAVRRCHLVNTHLDSRRLEHKRAQAEQVAACISFGGQAGDVVVATGDWNIASGTQLYGELTALLKSAMPGIIDSYGGADAGTMRRLTKKKPALYLNQLLGRPATFHPPSHTDAVLDHTFVGQEPAPPVVQRSGTNALQVHVEAAAPVDYRSKFGEPVSDHLGVATVVRIA